MTRIRLSGRAAVLLPTGEVALGVLAFVAAVLRLAGLRWLPLDAREASLALEAAGISAPNVVAPPAPLLVTLERIVFWIVGPGDGAARLVPVLAGVCLVIAAGLLWRGVGWSIALGCAAVFAVSPAWVFYGRIVSSESLAAAAVMACVAAALAPVRVRRWAVPVALAAAATSGPPVVTALVVAVLGVVATRGAMRAVRDWASETWPDSATRLQALGVWLVATALLATALLTRIDGLMDLLTTPVAWLERFEVGGGQFDVFLSLASYAPVTLLFGLVGLVLAVRRSPSLGGLLALWSGVAFFVVVLGGDPLLLAELLLPLALATGVALVGLAESLSEHFRWSEEGVMAAILVLIVVFAWLQGAAFAAEEAAASDHLAQALGAVAMAGLLVLLYAILWGWRVTFRAVGLATVVVLAAVAWTHGSDLVYASTTVLREPIRADYATPDLARLHDAVSRTIGVPGVTEAPPPPTVLVDANLRQALVPSVAWALRDVPDVQWAAEPGATGDLVVREAGATSPSNGAALVFSPVAHWQRRFPLPGGARTENVQGMVAWALLRRLPGRDRTGDIVYDRIELLRQSTSEGESNG